MSCVGTTGLPLLDRRLLLQSRLAGRLDRRGRFGQECHDIPPVPGTMESQVAFAFDELAKSRLSFEFATTY